MNVTFERVEKGKDEWLTPPEIINSLGDFDLDPCSPIIRPWDTAKCHYTLIDNGLHKEWYGRVWCNPPYGNEASKWLKKCSYHGNATALTFARTETKMFFESIWSSATAILFIKGRIKFHHVSGKRGGNAGAPSVLVAYGYDNAFKLSKCNIPGKFINLK